MKGVVLAKLMHRVVFSKSILQKIARFGSSILMNGDAAEGRYDSLFTLGSS